MIQTWLQPGPRVRERGMIQAATAAPQWERRYADDQAVIFQRAGGL